MFQKKKKRDTNLITKNSDHNHFTFNIIQKYSLKQLLYYKNYMRFLRIGSLSGL